MEALAMDKSRDGLTTGQAVLSERDRPAAPLGQAGQDLGGHERAEEDLRASEMRMRLLMRYARCILWSGEVVGLPGWQDDASGACLAWSIGIQDEEGAQAVLPLDVSGGRSYSLAWFASRDPGEAAIRGAAAATALAAGADHYAHEFRCTDRYGAARWLHEEVTLCPVAPGRWEAYGVLTEVTERRRAEAALRDSEERYRLLLQNASDAVFVHEVSADEPALILEVNDRACRLLGYTAAEFLRMTIGQIDVPEQRARLPAILRQLHATGAARFETEHQTKDGRRIPVEVCTCMFTLHGKPMVLSVARDITAHKQAEAALREQMDELQRWHDVTLGREGRVLELKDGVNQVLIQAGLPPRYPQVAEGTDTGGAEAAKNEVGG
jgi:PAS domain S-box-containing protein